MEPLSVFNRYLPGFDPRRRGVDFDYGVDKMVSGGLVNDDGHYTDAGKLPNHPTFSNQSVFATDTSPGGSWSNREGRWIFNPSDKQLLTRGYMNKLQEYFNDEYGRGIDGVSLPFGSEMQRTRMPRPR